jgi:outer membrane immunogenic protein
MNRDVFCILAVISPIVLGPASAVAADMPTPFKAPVIPEIAVWNGWYVGINGGAINTRDSVVRFTGTDTGGGGLGAALAAGAIPNSFGFDYNGYLLGGTVGYNWQIHPLWVVGIEGDLDGGKAKQGVNIPSISGAPIVNTIITREIDDLATIRARLGLTIVGPLMFYATGGAAFAEHKLGIGATGALATPINTSSQTSGFVTGWTTGFGVEFMWGQHLSFKGEYLYVDFGNINSAITYTYPGNTSSLSGVVKDRDNVVRVGVNYRF